MGYCETGTQYTEQSSKATARTNGEIDRSRTGCRREIALPAEVSICTFQYNWCGPNPEGLGILLGTVEETINGKHCFRLAPGLIIPGERESVPVGKLQNNAAGCRARV